MSTTKSLLLAAATLSSVIASAQQPKTDTLRAYFNKLVSSGQDNDKTLLKQKLYSLLQTNEESNWITAGNFFYQLKMTSTTDSLSKAERAHFPQGILVRNDSARTIYNAKTAEEKEALYKKWIKQFPPEKLGPDRIMYDYVRNDIARQYAMEDNVPKALYYTNLIETRAWKGEGYAGTAAAIAAKGHDKEAAELLRKAIGISYDYRTSLKDDPMAKFAATGFVSYCTRYADLLYKEHQYDSALRYITLAHDSAGNVRGNINEIYSNILLAQGKDQPAFDKIDEAVQAGQATPAMKTSLRSLYIKLKGSDKGYDDYLVKVDQQLTAKFIRELPKQMLNLQAPDFTLTDLDGNTVSLESLKGKTVVLDFWATWCGPCKASFPAMQMAVNKYKDTSDVRFLFIHTWEHDDTATQAARHFIAGKQYSFQVLMDLKDKSTGTNKVVEAFNVTGIPTKFVIDKTGRIRFRLTGFEGGNDAAVDELTAMITLARK